MSDVIPRSSLNALIKSHGFVGMAKIVAFTDGNKIRIWVMGSVVASPVARLRVGGGYSVPPQRVSLCG